VFEATFAIYVTCRCSLGFSFFTSCSAFHLYFKLIADWVLSQSAISLNWVLSNVFYIVIMEAVGFRFGSDFLYIV